MTYYYTDQAELEAARNEIAELKDTIKGLKSIIDNQNDKIASLKSQANAVYGKQTKRKVVQK